MSQAGRQKVNVKWIDQEVSGMKIKLLAICCLLACASLTRHSNAQSSDSLAIDSYKSPALSAALEWAVPTLGYAYAGRWRKGVLPSVLRIGGVVLIVCAYTGQETIPNPYIAGEVMGVIGTVWAMTGAAHTAKQTNEWIRNANVRFSLALDYNRRPRVGICLQI